MTRKILLIGRHGDAPQRPEGGSYDELKPEALVKIYNNVGIPLRDLVEGITLGQSFLTNSETERTRYTGQAVFIGAFDMQPSIGKNPPKTKEDFLNYDFSRFEMNRDERLNIITPGFSLPAYKAAGNATPNINHGLKYPEATEHAGVIVDTYNYISSRVKGSFVDSINKLFHGKDFGIVVTHACYAEPGLIGLINTSGKAPVEKVEDIGGVLGMGEFATIIFDKSNGVYKPTLELKGQKYALQLDRYL